MKKFINVAAWAIPVALLAWFTYTLIQHTKPQMQNKPQEITITVNFNNKPDFGTETVETTRQVPVACPFSGERKTSEAKTIVKKTQSEPSERRVVITEDAFKETMQRVAYETRKEAQNEYDKNFSILLTILTIFGIAWPLIIGLAQFKFNEREIRKIDDAEKTVKDAIKLAKITTEQAETAVNLTKDAVEKVEHVREQVDTLGNSTQNLKQYIASSFEGLMTICAMNCQTSSDITNKVLNFYNFVVGFDNALNCYISIKNADAVIRLLKAFGHIVNKERQQSEDVVKNALKMLKAEAKQEPKFHSGKEIKELLGEENIELYRQYRAFFIDLYPWKFNGDGEPNEN